MGRRRSREKQAVNPNEPPVPEVKVRYSHLLAYVRPYWVRMSIATVGLVGASLMGLAFPLAIQQVLDSALGEDSSLETLNQLSLGLLGIFAIQAVFYFIQGYNLAYVGERVVIDLRENLFERLTYLSLDFYSERRVGELVSRLSSDATKLRSTLTSDLTSLLSQSLGLIGSVAIMVYLNWRLMAFLLLLIPVIIAIGAFFGFWLQRISTEQQDAIADTTVIAEETLSGIRVVKSFVREGYENARYRNSMAEVFRVAIRLIRVRQIFGPIMAFIGFGSLAGFLWFGGREVIAGRSTGGELAAFMLYGASVAASISTFVGLYSNFQEALGATKRIFEVLETPPSVADAPDARALPSVTGLVELKNVNFSYDQRTPVLQDITLTIQPGEALALVGPSGAGKTTLFNLLPRFYDPDSGQICVDGHDLKSVTQDSLRSQIALVPQDTQLFGGTIRDNILYGRLDASEADLIAAAKAANAHDFIMDLPDGYDTVVGERGVKLSGGQRQRVSIARAILKDPRILLLDEATSSLDSESEGLVQEALDRLMQGRTTVIIAHRLSTIRAVDRIAVLNEGQLAELGTHDELMVRGGLYARLYNMQFREGQPGLVSGLA